MKIHFLCKPLNVCVKGLDFNEKINFTKNLFICILSIVLEAQCLIHNDIDDFYTQYIIKFYRETLWFRTKFYMIFITIKMVSMKIMNIECPSKCLFGVVAEKKDHV